MLFVSLISVVIGELNDPGSNRVERLKDFVIVDLKRVEKSVIAQEVTYVPQCEYAKTWSYPR